MVVVGSPTSIEAGRNLVADEDAGVIAAYATLSIDVESVIAGRRIDGGGPAMKVEFFIDEPESYELFEETWPAERVMLFLRNFVFQEAGEPPAPPPFLVERPNGA